MSTPEPREFVERPLPLVGGAGFFAALGAYAIWDMFIQGTNPDMMLRFLDLTPTHPIGWLALVGCVGMVLAMFWKLAFGRTRIVIDGDELGFGARGERRVRREDVVGIDLDEPDVVKVLLARPVSATTRERAMLPDDVDDVEIFDERIRDWEQVGPAVQRWYHAGT